MITKTLEINWHDGQAVYSVDFSPDGQRFVTAGADASVRIWSVQRQLHKMESHKESPKHAHNDSRQLPVSIDFLSELKRHSSPVNVVRFCPNGEYLASAGDDACIILWRLSANKETTFGGEYSEFEKETWTATHMLYGHNKEIYDLAWSPCGKYFVTASIDNTARVWSVAERTVIHVFTDHTHYVQGVTWDPLGQYVATQSSDRTVAIYSYQKGPQGKLQFGSCTKRHGFLDRAKIDREMTPKDITATTTPATNGTESTTSKTTDDASSTFRLYHDENLVSFFRRLSASPDGGFLVTPAGLGKNNMANATTDDDMQHCSYIFPRNTIYKYPIAYTGNHNKPSIAVRWCPQTFERRLTKRSSLFNLPYRLVYAVATQDSVYIYDTQQERPICAISGMHYAPITDLAWSNDGTILTFSSADGYCSAVVFSNNELGVPMTRPSTAHELQDQIMTDATEINKPTPQPSLPAVTTLDQWTKSVHSPVTAAASTSSSASSSTTSSPTPKRRITPTLVSSTTDKKRRITPIQVLPAPNAS